MGAKQLTAESYQRTRSAPGIVVIGWQSAGDDSAPLVDEALVENGVVTVATVDGEAEHRLAAMEHILTLPTLVIHRDGFEVFRTSEPFGPAELTAIIASVRDLDMEDVRTRAALQQADDLRGG